MTSQKTKFVKLWDTLVYPERTEMKTVLPPKASLLVQIGGDRGISIVSNEPMESSEHKVPISPRQFALKGWFFAWGLHLVFF